MSEFVWPIRVYYEDTDSGGVVYHANYLRFMERARTEWLRSLGFEQDTLRDAHGVLFAVRSAQLDYLKPAHFNDALEVSAQIIKRGRASLVFAQEVRRVQDGEVVCRGTIKIASVLADGLRPCPIPESIVARLEAGSPA